MNEYVDEKSNALSLPRYGRRDMAPAKIYGNSHKSGGDLYYLFTYDSLTEVLRKIAQNSATFHDATFRYRYRNAALGEICANFHQDAQTEFPDTVAHGTLRRFEPAQSSPTSASTSTPTHLNSHLAENLVEPSGQYEIP